MESENLNTERGDVRAAAIDVVCGLIENGDGRDTYCASGQWGSRKLAFGNFLVARSTLGET